MQISLAQALVLKSTLNEERFNMETMFERAATMEVSKDEQETAPPSPSFEELRVKHQEIKKDLRHLERVIHEKNLTETVRWDEEDITLSEAISLAKDCRSEVNFFQRFATLPPQERVRHYSGDNGAAVFRKRMFDADRLQKELDKLTRQVNRLSIEIDKAGHNAILDFPAASKYL